MAFSSGPILFRKTEIRAHVVRYICTQKVSWSAAHNAGVKASITGRDDLALIASEIPASFTKYNFQVAPVTVYIKGNTYKNGSEGDQRPDFEFWSADAVTGKSGIEGEKDKFSVGGQDQDDGRYDSKEYGSYRAAVLPPRRQCLFSSLSYPAAKTDR